jgi:hypothetical protein
VPAPPSRGRAQTEFGRDSGRSSPPPGDWRRLIDHTQTHGGSVPTAARAGYNGTGSSRGRGLGRFFSERVNGFNHEEASLSYPIGNLRDSYSRDRDRDSDKYRGASSESTPSEADQVSGRETILRRRVPFRA